MAGITVELDARDLERLAEALHRASRAERRRLTTALAAVGESGARERITAGGPGPQGEVWPPRAPGAPSSKKLLNRDGHLHDSITSSANTHTARWGSNRVYARIHQLGGIITPRAGRVLRFMLGDQAVFARRVTIPARPYLGWGPTERVEADRVVTRWLDQAFAGAGGGR